jgi:hypothetical protein
MNGLSFRVSRLLLTLNQGEKAHSADKKARMCSKNGFFCEFLKNVFTFSIKLLVTCALKIYIFPYFAKRSMHLVLNNFWFQTPPTPFANFHKNFWSARRHNFD